MICENCGENKNILTSNSGFPLYYYGAGPYNPQDAKYYFCGPECSNAWYKENIYKPNDTENPT